MVCTKMPAYFIATAHSMIIDRLDSRGVFGSANNATCILRRGFCTSVLFLCSLLTLHTEPFVVEFVKTDYTVLESAGSVEVCVNLTRPLVDILDENLFVNVVDFSISSAIPHDSVLASK